ncbi:DHA2 family efflux MFS transporter permease subunit [Novosphingobium album (ex Hu et al. 2023)]|uniref:DHA2 family efflux MFS transporter permease subunit n=1 Tax=Novosphingobium album (ex Hu et al. 2023) TaxID=2930093 RepID=A0ABT0AZT3_9SPHN|nr:DHA2 family efflux MFS transporter permease subunit [Novosphingobium album (ex Hu et al. 2023)]MCJ2178313.1 DHA2 family efflux MFS transporter permease subunit [Novosphingobium album (ex Hu et al. 2023)]
MTSASYPDPSRRLLITGATIIAVLMVTLDGTIAVIALPHMQSTLGASQDQIAWVLTSYLLAGAIATPLAGWMADRFGRVRVMALSVVGFTLSSIACGLAPTLEFLVFARLVQGLSGASLVPLSQVLLLDINPPEKQGPAIAAFGMGTLLGPMMGPILGGWLTEYVSWRAIFLINAPVGVMAFTGLMVFARDLHPGRASPFDARGFAFVSISIAAFQLMLDRGQMLDWFDSTEVCIEGTVAALFAYVAVVHMLTARNPFIKPAIFKDRNFLLGTMLSAVTGIFLTGVIPIMTSMMQQLLGYPVLLTGLISTPRAIGNIITIMLVGRLVSVMDARYLIFTGMALLVCSLALLSSMSLEVSQTRMGFVTFLQGCGSGLLFLPLTMIVFSTLPREHRNEGSTIFTLVRSLSGAAGISLIQAATIRDQAQVQSHLVERVRPDNPVIGWSMPDFDVMNVPGVQAMMGEIGRQAAMVAYVNSYRAILILAVIAAPLALFMRKANRTAEPLAAVHGE